MSILPDIDRQIDDLRRLMIVRFNHQDERITKIMAKIDEEATAVAANTAKINQMSDVITAMAEGHSTISDEIAALKATVPPDTDFTALDAALADQSASVAKAAALVPLPTT